MEHLPKIKGTEYVQGDLKFTINPSSIKETLELVDKLDSPKKALLARLNDIPTEPFDRRLLRPVLLGLVQNEWYQFCSADKKVPQECVASQATRLSRYKDQLEELKKAPSEFDLVGKRAKKAASEPVERVSMRYSLVAAKKDEYLAYTGQRYLIVLALQALKEASVRQIADYIPTMPQVATVLTQLEELRSTGSLIPSQPNCSFHINAFKKDGIVVVTNEKETAKPETNVPAPANKKK